MMQFFSTSNRTPLSNFVDSHFASGGDKLFPLTKDSLEKSLDRESDVELRLAIQVNAKQGNYPTAIALLNQLLTRYPENAMDYNYLGLLYFRQNQLFYAIQNYNKAITLNPHLVQAYNNRGNCYALQGNCLNALLDYERVIDLNPYNGSVRINLGILFRKLGEYDSAIENLDLALRFNVSWQGRIYAERGYVYYLRGDWNCAIADYHRALTHLVENDPIRQQVKQLLKQFFQHPSDDHSRWKNSFGFS